ncbi:NADP-dependent oxidoreductase [Nocardia camponoti]|uniref:NADPH:quinone reductase n=1 Tax=Nocardia camponoti TaxID=1616106 RepID=A0A917VBH7_9NOCA|nr:NADP-dependent oxidoreductase [Nocardia camponoti]GGK59855.1 NADPH:quinone reductase [Nocardia camponoti]
MRAIVQQVFGGPEVLEVVEVERPTAGPGEVVVRVAASGVNPVDVAVRSGAFPLLGEPSFTLGWDIAGTVVEVGEGVDFAIGDEVFGMPRFPAAGNGYAEYVAAPASHFALKPTALSQVEAAAVPLVALTAWQGLVEGAGVKEGDRVLIHRAAGGVGHLAVQIAKARGAYVIALASAEKHDFVRSLGADEVIDYRTVDFTEVVDKIDVVVDSVDDGARSLTVLNPGGALVTITQHRDAELADLVTSAGRRFVGTSVDADAPGLPEVAALLESGALRVEVAATFPLEKVAAAHELVATGRTTGKVVLTVA